MNNVDGFRYLPPRRHGHRRRGCWIREKPPWLPPFAQQSTIFLPVGDSSALEQKDPIFLYPEELEAYRLVYLEGKTQEEAARIMRVSRGTLWRLLYNARRKIGLAIVQRRPLVILS